MASDDAPDRNELRVVRRHEVVGSLNGLLIALWSDGPVMIALSGAEGQNWVALFEDAEKLDAAYAAIGVSSYQISRLTDAEKVIGALREHGIRVMMNLTKRDDGLLKFTELRFQALAEA